MRKSLLALVFLVACGGTAAITTTEPTEPTTTQASTTATTTAVETTTTTRLTTTTFFIRDPSQEDLTQYLLLATLALSTTEFSLDSLGDDLYPVMLRDGAVAACIGLDEGRDLPATMRYAFSSLPAEVPDPLTNTFGMLLGQILVTSGVEAYCPQLAVDADAIELANAWSEITGGAVIDRESIIEDGTWVVGEDVQPGTYRNGGSADLCYWERLSGFGGTSDDVIANGLSEDPQIVTIASTDAGFVSEDCGIWTLQD